MSNRLKQEVSPYLLQHADNPVNWYPWCPEAFEKARAEDKPIFLSIGYSTCHWCHVMAHESFEDTEIAEILNRAFISIKVDREERPDIDSVYMSVCQAFTGSGGWPMSIFMTWDRKPFYAGTYFPPQSRWGTPGFSELLRAIEGQWERNREELLQSAEQVISALKKADVQKPDESGCELVQLAFQQFAACFDNVWGGFGSAPKFPTPHNLLFLMLYAREKQNPNAMAMVEKTLEQMRKGGIFDQIGGGFSRYSTDRYFLAPHFEKMLYDNAWLIMAYTVAYHVTGKSLYLSTAKESAAYILREMTAEGGAFYSAQDADSEGVEGKFYTFEYQEILECLGQEKGTRFAQAFDITPGGNFEGTNIPNLLKSNRCPADFQEERRALWEYRKQREKLHLDDKVLTAWNAMTIAALSMLYRASGDWQYLRTAERAQKFIMAHLQEHGQFYTSFCGGKHAEHGFLDDYAYEIAALLELYSSTLEQSYLEQAEAFCEEAVKRFIDQECSGFNLSEGTELFMNPKETYDGAIPSGNAMMAYNLVRLYQLTQREQYQLLAERQLEFLSSAAQEYPMGHSMFLLAKLLYEEAPRHITLVWENPVDLQRAREKVPFWANITAVQANSRYPLVNGKATLYICDERGCQMPTNQIVF